MRPAGRCATADIDLEALAQAYGHRPLSAAGRRRAERAVFELPPRSWTLDVGGGPGAHAAVWTELGYRGVVLDPGAAMTATAVNAGVLAVRGIAQQMPLRSGVFHLAYFHLSIHYGDWRAALDEARRVLHQDGRLWIWTLGAHHHEASFLARWFPAIETLDRDRFPDPDAVAAYLARRGGEVETGREIEVKTRPAGEWAAAVEAGFVSTLQLLTPDELATGLDAFRSAHPDPSAMVEYSMYWTWLIVRP